MVSSKKVINSFMYVRTCISQFILTFLNAIDEYPEIAWGIEKSGGKHKPLLIARPKVTEYAVKFEILYCGICHSDVHTGKNDWGPCKNS